MVRKWGPYAVAVLWVYLLVWPHVASLSNWNTNIWPLADHTSTVMWVLKEGYTELWSATVERALAAGVTPPTTAGLAKLEIYPSYSAMVEIDVALSNSATHYIDLQAVGTNVETYLATTNGAGEYPRSIPAYTFTGLWAQAGNTNVLGDDYGWPQRYGLDARRRALNRMQWIQASYVSVSPYNHYRTWTNSVIKEEWYEWGDQAANGPFAQVNTNPVGADLYIGYSTPSNIGYVLYSEVNIPIAATLDLYRCSLTVTPAGATSALSLAASEVLTSVGGGTNGRYEMEFTNTDWYTITAPEPGADHQFWLYEYEGVLRWSFTYTE